MPHILKSIFLPFFLCSMLIACGGGGDSDEPEPEVITQPEPDPAPEEPAPEPEPPVPEPEPPLPEPPTPPEPEPEPEPPAPEPEPPTPPSEPEPTTASITLSWTVPEARENGDDLGLGDIGGYEVSFRNTVDELYTSIVINDAAISEYVIEDLVEGQYQFRIASFDADGLYGDFSEPVTTTVKAN